MTVTFFWLLIYVFFLLPFTCHPHNNNNKKKVCKKVNFILLTGWQKLMEKLMPVFFLDLQCSGKTTRYERLLSFPFQTKIKKIFKKKEPGIFFALILCPGIIFFKNFFFVLPPYHQSFEIKSNTRGRKDKKLFFCMHFFSVHITLFLLLEFLTVEISGMELTFF